ncbi:hypothetical protein ACI6PS_03665 [Flavobacterium sp. PLA-1-15]|uniref:hypothetical protein n=1 Tax=Flavobacterium sp. PLA-1-15 TaxID=3380533 RepID=UPI003B761232
MENYNIQFKISKKDFPKIKDEASQKIAISDMIKDGTAILTFSVKSEEHFDYPAESGNFPDWDEKIKTDLLIETSLLLNDFDAHDENEIRRRTCNQISNSNIFDYLYEDKQGRHISFGYIHPPDIKPSAAQIKLARKVGEEERKKEKEHKKPAEQLNFFGKKRKSK